MRDDSLAWMTEEAVELVIPMPEIGHGDDSNGSCSRLAQAVVIKLISAPESITALHSY